MTEKRCTGPCKDVKPIGEFDFKDKKKSIRRSYCTICRRLLLRDHYKRNKGYYKKKTKQRNKNIRAENYEKLYKYLLEHPCVDCGEDDLVVLDFDHVDRNLKISAVTFLVRSAYSWRAIEEEIKKCEVRCANCHRRRTAKQFNWRRALVDQE